MERSIFTLEGKVIVVVGAASGIGEAVALGAAREGAAFVACLDLNAAGAKAVAGRIHSLGGSAGAGALDVADADPVNACLDDLAGMHGRFDVLVCTPSI